MASRNNSRTTTTKKGHRATKGTTTRSARPTTTRRTTTARNSNRRTTTNRTTAGNAGGNNNNNNNNNNGMANRPIKPGFVSHTEFASTDPAATKAFLTEVFGYKFGDPAETPTGPYHMWQHSSGETGGGIRATMPNEPAGVTPYVEVKDIDATYQKALRAGAKEMFAPMSVGNGSGRIACVGVPGGGMVGLWSNK